MWLRHYCYERICPPPLEDVPGDAPKAPRRKRALAHAPPAPLTQPLCLAPSRPPLLSPFRRRRRPRMGLLRQPFVAMLSPARAEARRGWLRVRRAPSASRGERETTVAAPWTSPVNIWQ